MNWLLIVYLIGVVVHAGLFIVTYETDGYSFETVVFCSVFHPLIIAVFILMALCSLIVALLHFVSEVINLLKEKVTNRE